MHTAMQNALRAASSAWLLPYALIAGASVFDLGFPSATGPVPSRAGSWLSGSIAGAAPMPATVEELENPWFEADYQLDSADFGDESDEYYDDNSDEDGYTEDDTAYDDDEEDSEGYQSPENIRLYDEATRLPSASRSILSWFNTKVARSCYSYNKCYSKKAKGSNRPGRQAHNKTDPHGRQFDGAAHSAAIPLPVSEAFLNVESAEMARRFRQLVSDIQQAVASDSTLDECGENAHLKFFMDNNCFNTLMSTLRGEMKPQELIPSDEEIKELRNTLDNYVTGHEIITAAELDTSFKLVISRAFYELYTLTKTITWRLLRREYSLSFPQFYSACYSYLAEPAAAPREEYLQPFVFSMLEDALKFNLEHQLVFFSGDHTSHAPEEYSALFDAEPLADMLLNKPPTASLIVLGQIIEEQVRKSSLALHGSICPTPSDSAAGTSFIGGLSLLEAGLVASNTVTVFVLAVATCFLLSLTRKLQEKKSRENVYECKQQRRERKGNGEGELVFNFEELTVSIALE
ncbi:hypothetical protein PAPHI01_2336 [Pancytospora philotis]|nr:hypothetical protein PAPHI01_2336 [Pancytospora philotis]